MVNIAKFDTSSEQEEGVWITLYLDGQEVKDEAGPAKVKVGGSDASWYAEKLREAANAYDMQDLSERDRRAIVVAALLLDWTDNITDAEGNPFPKTAEGRKALSENSLIRQNVWNFADKQRNFIMHRLIAQSNGSADASGLKQSPSLKSQGEKSEKTTRARRTRASRKNTKGQDQVVATAS